MVTNRFNSIRLATHCIKKLIHNFFIKYLCFLYVVAFKFKGQNYPRKMKKLLSPSLLVALLIGLTSVSCSDNGLSENDITGIYTAKKIGTATTFPLTIYEAAFDGLQVEAMWLSTLQSIPVTLTDDGFTFSTELFSSPIFGSADVNGNVITILYSIDGGDTIRMVASR